MQSVLVGAFSFFVLGIASVHAVVNYVPIADTSVIVTGVRSDSSTTDSVVLTSSYTSAGITYAGLYDGSLSGASTAPNSRWHALTPVIAGETVSSATLYGPNTSLFDPSLGAGNLTAVGSYKYAEGSSGPGFDHGVLYVGPVDGSGTWTQIDATPLVANGDSLLNTIAHSTMGDLAVGNYDTRLATGNAFIYNKTTHVWKNLNPTGSASVTAYGIWQNGGSSSTSYTITGGFSDVNSGGADEGYIVDYDSVTGVLSHLKTYNYNNLPISALISHFDGITATSTGFNLTGDYLVGGTGLGAFYASVKVNPDNTFSEATWTNIAYTSGGVTAQGTSGNTVVENNALGIFVNGGVTQSYIATVSPDSFGVSISVAKSKSRATFTITNTGNNSDSFSLSRITKVANSYSGPTPAHPGKSPFKITFSLNGASVTKAVEAGTATTGYIAAGGSASLVEEVKPAGKVAFKRTISTTVQATSATDPSKSASAKVKLTLSSQ